MSFQFDKAIQIGGKRIGDDTQTYIIAEGGVNHNGDVETGKRLVTAAASAGADAIKFQMFHPEDLLLPTVDKAGYQTVTSGGGSQYDMLLQLALSIEDMEILKKVAYSEGIAFICTPFDLRSLREIEAMGIDAVKIASTDTTNIPFLHDLAAVNAPLILSTAMSYMAEVERALDVFAEEDKRDIAVLQCTGNYPAPAAEANLRVIQKYKASFGCIVGYSDHTVGHEAATLSIAAGGRIIEKHLTLDKSLPGPDHQASADPSEFRAMVKAVRRSESILGSPQKMLTPSEVPNRVSLQKSIVLGRDVKENDSLVVADVRLLRTGGRGISPVYWDEVSRMRLSSSKKAGHILNWDDLKW